jgi:uncharacterized membrane protein YcjF (UPF0283 family)
VDLTIDFGRFETAPFSPPNLIIIGGGEEVLSHFAILGRVFLFGKNVNPTLTFITNAPSRTDPRLKTSNDLPMKSVKKSTLSRWIIELTIYAVLVSGYVILVLHFLVNWLKELFTNHREIYAYASILLMIAQAVGLERLTSGLVHLARRRE